MATIFSQNYPNVEDYPMIDLPGYVPIVSSVAQLSGSLSQATNVKVSPDEIVDFETHAKAVYEREELKETAGYSDFGFGIWKKDTENDPKLYDDGRIQDTNGEVSSLYFLC